MRPSGRIFSSTTMTRSSSSSIALMILPKSLWILVFEHLREIAASFAPTFARSASMRQSFANASLRSPFSMIAHRFGDFFLEVLRTHSSSCGSIVAAADTRAFGLADLLLQLVDRFDDLLDLACANSTAPRNSSSVISLPPPSTIITASEVPATTMSMPPVSYCGIVGLQMYLPFSSRPTRTAATVLSNGMSERRAPRRAAHARARRRRVRDRSTGRS